MVREMDRECGREHGRGYDREHFGLGFVSASQ